MGVYFEDASDEFEWDTAKAIANLDKHGVDFQAAIRVFATSFLTLRSGTIEEERWKAISSVDGVVITVIFTWRGSKRRIISARRAKRNERRTYRQAYPG
jgi:uncharacterized protein